MKEWLDAAGWIVALLITFALVVICAYYATRLLGKRYGVQNSGSGLITVLDRSYVGQDRQLLLVKVADKTILIGVTASHIEKLCDLDPEKLPSLPVKTSDVNFAELLKGFITKGRNSEKREEDEANQ